MNVKCPNCRFKFDVNPTDVNANNEVNCTCPRCGMAFTSQYVAPANNLPMGEPARPIGAPMPPVDVEEQEADLYYAVMKRMKAGQHEEAGIYLEKLLALKPDEPIYRNIKEQIDNIKRAYLLATKYINSGQLNLAEMYVDDLLKVNPNDPMYLSLRNDLDQAQHRELLRQEELLRQQKAHRREEERRHEEARQEELRILEEAQLEEERLFAEAQHKAQEEKIIELIESGELDNAESELDKALEDSPDDPEYLSLKERLEECRVEELRQKEILRQAEEELREEERMGKDEVSEHLKQVLYGENDDSNDSSGSGCMVVILAFIVTLASLALL